jgi:hypothetical protein
MDVDGHEDEVLIGAKHSIEEFLPALGFFTPL